MTRGGVEVEGAVGVSKRVLIGEEDGAPNFIMRQFTLQPGGKTPYHTHNWEHEVYVLSGTGIARHGDGESDISAGCAVLVLPNEEHGFVNTGEVIPISSDSLKTGTVIEMLFPKI